MIALTFDAVRRCAACRRLMLPLLFALTAGCDDAHVVACFGDQDFCEKVITINVPPEADSGADQEVAGGDTVSLDGTGSTDLDGRIASFSWTQRSGIPVTLRDAGQATATFDAPEVGVQETLTFRLTVVDDDQAAAEDDVTVSVQPAEVMAARTGFTLLSRSIAPDPVLVPATCTAAPLLTGPAWFAQAGLWLTAHTTALADADPDEVTRFLDAARVLLARAGQDSPADGAAESLWLHGLDELHRFALDRDPALAQWARAQLAPLDESLHERLRRGEITLMLARGEPFVIPLDPATATGMAVASVRRTACRSGLDPLRLSADTVYLLWIR